VCLFAAACTRVPGGRGPWRVGPLHFGLTVAEMAQAFPDADRQLDAYDTPLGQTWTIVGPFSGKAPAPEWLTAGVERISLTFWNERLLRVRFHYATADLARALELRKVFDRGYRPEADLSQGERLFLEYRAPDTQVFLSGGGDQNVATAFVDREAYRAMDVSRRRMQKKAEESFSIEGLRLGASPSDARAVLGGTPAASDFFAGLESLAWNDAAKKRELILGFSPELGLAAIARLHAERWNPRQVQEKIWELTRAFGQGQVKPADNGRTLTIDAGAIHVSLMVTDCADQGCMVSEGWLWSGPESP